MDNRLLGQDISIRIVEGGVVQNQIDSISSLNQETTFTELKAGYLGETADRFDSVYSGEKGDFMFHTTTANWVLVKQAMRDKARRRRPNLVFNVVVTSLYADGSTLIEVYPDVAWGSVPKTTGKRDDYVSVKLSFTGSSVSEQVNTLA